MATKTITINPPLLQAGDYFHVQYRLRPYSGWVDLGMQTNLPFNIYGISSGFYDLSVELFSGSPPISCGVKVYKFSSKEAIDCPVGIGQTSYLDGYGNCIVNLSGSAPPLLYQYFVVNIIDSNNNIVSTGVFPNINGQSLLFAYNVMLTYKVEVLFFYDRKGDYYNQCLYTDLTPSSSSCEGLSVLSSDLTEVRGTWYLRIRFTNSTPMTRAINISYYQQGAGGFPSPGLDYGVMTVSSMVSPVMIRISPLFTVLSSLIYGWSFHDACGNKLTGTAS